MTILRSYPPIKRIDCGFPKRGKDYLSQEEVDLLLGEGDKVIQEKLDGRPYSILLNKAQVFYEYLKDRHTIPYDFLPDFKIAIDVWDTINNRWTGLEGMHYLRANHGWHLAPLILRRVEPMKVDDLLPHLDLVSLYNPEHKIEGIVIKNYTEQIFGKIVNPAFEAEVDDPENLHPDKRRVPIRNKMSPAFYWR